MQVVKDSQSNSSLSAMSRGTLTLRTTGNEVGKKVLSDERYEFIEKFHNFVIGHGGRDRTIRLIKERTSEENHQFLDRDVRLFIKYCEFCQMMAIKSLKAKILPFNVSVNGPMDRLCMDLIGPITPKCGLLSLF
jgi:hypothetical protein